MTDQPVSPEQATDRFLRSLRRPLRLLVAISGGSDSTGLLIVLAQALKNPAHDGITLSAATIDHALRPEAADEALAVAALCHRLGIPHLIRRWQDAKPKNGISAAAREARYRLLAEAADMFQADAIVTAHTAGDQQETIAMRAARSDDPEALGLAGMADATLYDRRLWILRPFLDVTRDDIRRLVTEAGESWVDDPSNLDPHYERVRTRLALSTEPALATSTTSVSRLAIAQQAAALLHTHAHLTARSVLHLHPAIANADPQVLRYLLATLFAIMGGTSHRPGVAVMDRVMALVAAGQGRLTASRCLFHARRDGFTLLREARAILPLHLASGESGTWDQRFRVANSTGHAIVIGAADNCFPLPLPDEIAPRLAPVIRRVTPATSLQFADDIAKPGIIDAVGIEPVFPLFDRFLPEHDLAFADGVTKLFERPAFPPPPRRSC